MTQEFTKGQRVQCVYGQEHFGLYKGNEYTVEVAEPFDDSPSGTLMLRLRELPGERFWASRFVLPKEKPLVHKPGMKMFCNVGEFNEGLLTGHIYTIKEVASSNNGRAIEDSLVLEELPHRGFDAARFRPVEDPSVPQAMCAEEKCCGKPGMCELRVGSIKGPRETYRACECPDVRCVHDPLGVVLPKPPSHIFTPGRIEVVDEVAERIQAEVVQGYPDNNPKSAIGVKKAPLHLVPPSAIIALARGFANGAAKYGPYNWRENKVAVSVYVGALMRHLIAYWDGEDIAEDSGELHIDHILSGAAILIDALETGNLIDDRPTPGAASRMLDDYFRRNA